ncbi:adenylyl-sulfate kinase [Candidatus Marinimicrobia bacterium]|nr:adenylyl-sulfate kinase [Candidatus Neomarinimicrobiota bacterium]
MISSKIIWLTGQPGSGKTTLANHLKEKLEKDNPSKNVIIVDGDDLRDITTNKDYSRKGREKNIRTAQKIAQFLYNKKFIVLVALVAPYRNIRESLKKECSVLECFLSTSEVRGREHFFAEDYEKPLENYLDIDTGKYSIDDSVELIYQQLNDL